LPASQLAVVAATTQEPTAVAMPVEYTTPPQALAVDAETSAVFDRRSLSIVMTSGVRDDRLTVLAVDDDPVNLRVLSTQLRPAGYRVVLASDGAEALEVFDAEGPFDLVLLDVMMPRMSGLEALGRLRAKATRAELPVILLTAKQQQEDVLAGFDAGANDYLTKPFSKKELLARIETHLTVAKTNHALRRFVPHEFLEALGRKHVTEVRLGDSVERRLAILFGDIRDFTRISEGLGPEKTFRFVNQCLKRITPSVRDNGGFIDKFIGDAVLALFPEDPKAAVDAAIAIERAIEETDAQDGDERFAFGIGIHVGPTMMGTIGDERRFEATVISDAVNQAARLEGMTKYVGARVLVSGDVVDELGSSYSLRPLGLMRPVGKETAIAVSEVLDADPVDLRENKHSYAPLFADATALLRAGSAAEALAIFTNLAAREPRDGAVKFFLAACHDAQLGHRVVVDGAIVLNRK
jgi:two-component system sensor histidine kinase ChiS